MVLVTLLAVLLSFYVNRYQRMYLAVELLKENDVFFQIAKESDLPWYDRLPWLPPAPHVISIHIGRPQKNFVAAVETLNSVGTVKTITLYQPKLEDLKTASQINSIEMIQGGSRFNTEQLRPFMSHKLKDVSVSGSSGIMREDVLEMLYSIPTLESVGTAQGDHDVPDALKEKRPDISIYITDFPP